MESLSHRRWFWRILEIHKIVRGKTPSYLKNKLPGLRRLLYRQSSSNTFHELKWKSLRYMSSFFPEAITSCNNVIAHFNDIPSFSVLKDNILSLIHRKKRCISGIHDPLGIRYLYQQRVGPWDISVPTKSGLKFLNISVPTKSGLKFFNISVPTKSALKFLNISVPTKGVLKFLNISVPTKECA